MILCLIKLLSYEELISNPFQLRGNIDAGVVVYESCYSCLVAGTKKQSSGEGGCTVRTEYNCQRSLYFCKQMSSNEIM